MKSDDDSQPTVKMELEDAIDMSSECSTHEDRFTEFASVKKENKENTEPHHKRTDSRMGKSSTRRAKTKDSARNQESLKKPMKQETASENELLTNSNGADSLRTRRIEANARERSRVHTIGAAFEALRQTVPSNCDQQKLSKLAVLRIAAAYIRALTSLLDDNSKDFAVGVEQCTQALLLDGVRSKYPKSVS